MAGWIVTRGDDGMLTYSLTYEGVEYGIRCRDEPNARRLVVDSMRLTLNLLEAGKRPGPDGQWREEDLPPRWWPGRGL